MGYTARLIKNNVYIYLETYSPRKQKVISKNEYRHLGFSTSMGIEEAKTRCKELNGDAKLQRESIKKTNTLKRIAQQQLVGSTYLPSPRISLFMTELENDYSDNPERLVNVKKLWVTAHKVISELQLDFTKFYDNRNLFHNYFRTKAYSPDYIKKLIWIINKWGEFSARKVQSYYKNIPKLPSTTKQTILNKRQAKIGIKRPAEIITFKELNNLKTSFQNNDLEEQWNWMFIAFNFGLRPTECDWLLNQSEIPIEWDKQNKCDVLRIYQSKLVSVSKDERYKVIPIYLKSQKEAITILETKKAKRPLNKSLKRLFKKNVQTYSPRKSFTDYMLENNFKLEDISIFLGHRSIDMTWKHYKGKTRFSLPSKKAA